LGAHAQVHRLYIAGLCVSKLKIRDACRQGPQEIRNLEGPLHIEAKQVDAERRGGRNTIKMLSHIGHPIGRRVERAPLCMPAEIPEERIEERDRCVAREARRGPAGDMGPKLQEEPQALAEVQRIR
jgi:hypothetical protein